MKKTVALAACLVAALHFQTLSAKPVSDSSATEKATSPTTVVINVDAEIVLTDVESTATLHGSASFVNSVVFSQRNDTLFVNRLLKKQFAGYGTVYLPVTGVCRIVVNSEASLKTLTALRLPELTILVNGACNVAVSSLGKLNVSDTEAFAFEHKTEVRRGKAAVYAINRETKAAHHF